MGIVFLVGIITNAAAVSNAGCEGIADGEIFVLECGESIADEVLFSTPGDDGIAAVIGSETGPDIIGGFDGVCTCQLEYTVGVGTLTFNRRIGEDVVNISGDSLDTVGIDAETADTGDVEVFDTGDISVEDSIDIHGDHVISCGTGGNHIADDGTGIGDLNFFQL